MCQNFKTIGLNVTNDRSLCSSWHITGGQCRGLNPVVFASEYIIIYFFNFKQPRSIYSLNQQSKLHETLQAERACPRFRYETIWTKSAYKFLAQGPFYLTWEKISKCSQSAESFFKMCVMTSRAKKSMATTPYLEYFSFLLWIQPLGLNPY